MKNGRSSSLSQDSGIMMVISTITIDAKGLERSSEIKPTRVPVNSWLAV